MSPEDISRYAEWADFSAAKIMDAGVHGAQQMVLSLGMVYAFVPAHGDSSVGAVRDSLCRTWTDDLRLSVLRVDFDTRQFSPWRMGEERRRLDGRTWGAFVRRVGNVDVLDAREAQTRELPQLLEYARRHYDIVAADLTGARAAYALEVLPVSQAIFLVSNADRASLEMVREKTAWLRSIGLEDRCSVVLRRADDRESIRRLAMRLGGVETSVTAG